MILINLLLYTKFCRNIHLYLIMNLLYISTDKASISKDMEKLISFN